MYKKLQADQEEKRNKKTERDERSPHKNANWICTQRNKHGQINASK